MALKPIADKSSPVRSSPPPRSATVDRCCQPRPGRLRLLSSKRKRKKGKKDKDNMSRLSCPSPRNETRWSQSAALTARMLPHPRIRTGSLVARRGAGSMELGRRIESWVGRHGLPGRSGAFDAGRHLVMAGLAGGRTWVSHVWLLSSSKLSSRRHSLSYFCSALILRTLPNHWPLVPAYVILIMDWEDTSEPRGAV